MRRLVRYTVVGALATTTHFLVLTLAVEATDWPAYLASGFGAVVGAQVAYFGNRRFTFAHRGAIVKSWFAFQSTAALGALVSMSIVAAATHVGLHYLLAQAIATGVVLALTFSINQVWAFR